MFTTGSTRRFTCVGAIGFHLLRRQDNACMPGVAIGVLRLTWLVGFIQALRSVDPSLGLRDPDRIRYVEVKC